jgi:aspartyl-tRNA(Asn)/glutamyl-tRNA(Gln) amidotransferase subunit B
VLNEEYLETIKVNLVESSFSRIKKYKDYWFNKEYINALIQSVEVNNYFEDLLKKWFDPKLVAKWIITYIIRYLNDSNLSIGDLKFSFEQFVEFLDFIKSWALQDAQAKIVIQEMIETWKSAKVIIDEKWFKPQDSGEVEKIVLEVMNANPKAIEDLKNGEMKAIWFLVWQVMQKSWWKANPKQVKEIIESKI